MKQKKALPRVEFIGQPKGECLTAGLRRSGIPALAVCIS